MADNCCQSWDYTGCTLVLDGLAHSNLMKRHILTCDPVNLSQFVVDPRTRHLSYWNRFTSPDPRVNNKYCWLASEKRVFAFYSLLFHLDAPSLVLENVCAEQSSAQRPRNWVGAPAVLLI
eukprot:1159619-Pelagomonas_calceolata.AAC.15